MFIFKFGSYTATISKQDQHQKMIGPITKQEAARRKQQSQKDKALAKNTQTLQQSKAMTVQQKQPKMSALNRQGGILVENDEFVQSLNGTSQNFSLTSNHLINPGQQDLFPWLSGIASRYEKFRFRSIQFLFKTRCSTNTPGFIMFGVDYDVVDQLPTNMQQFSAYDGTVESAMWKNFTFKAKPMPIRDVLVGNQPPNTDLRLYAPGRFMAVQGNTGNVGQVGDLWVKYSVEFTKRAIEAPIPLVGHVLASSNGTNIFNQIQQNNCTWLESITGGSTLNLTGYGDILMSVIYTLSSGTATMPTIMLNSTTQQTSTILNPINGATQGTVTQFLYQATIDGVCSLVWSAIPAAMSLIDLRLSNSNKTW